MFRTRILRTNQQTPFMEPVHVLGGGSIGLLFASSIRIAFPSYPLTMILRERHAPKLDTSGRHQYMNVCLFQNNRPRMVRFRGQVWGPQHGSHSKIQNLLLATKAPDALKSVKSVLSHIEPNAKIIILCNGAMAVQEELSSLLDNHPCRVILATTTHGAVRDVNDGGEIFHVTHLGVGKTFIQEEEQVAQLWDQSGLFATSLSGGDMDLLLWKKLAANCTINPLTSILDCTNGELVNDDYFRRVAPQIIAEVSLVAQQSMSSSSSSSSQLEPTNLRTFVNSVIADTSENTSSMRQDIQRRIPTEVNYLNGYVVKRGEDLGVEPPANKELVERIQNLEQSAAKSQ